MYSTLLREIAHSTDHTSRSLMRLFAARVQPAVEELSRARFRKELGNPPGKSGDRLRDQITWEQFLSRASGYSKFWIITRDGDYAQELQGKILVLNPVLHRELRIINPNIEVRYSSKLSEGIKDCISQPPAQSQHTPIDQEFMDFGRVEGSLDAVVRNTLLGHHQLLLSAQTVGRSTLSRRLDLNLHSVGAV